MKYTLEYFGNFDRRERTSSTFSLITGCWDSVKTLILCKHVTRIALAQKWLGIVFIQNSIDYDKDSNNYNIRKRFEQFEWNLQKTQLIHFIKADWIISVKRNNANYEILRKSLLFFPFIAIMIHDSNLLYHY